MDAGVISSGQPVFVDPHGHRLRRLRHGARVLAGAAAVYLALLALGLAGPATAPFSLFPGTTKAGESGTEAVRSGSGAAPNAALVRDASNGAGPASLGTARFGAGAFGPAPASAGTDPAAPGAASTPAAPGSAPSGTAPSGTAPTAAPQSQAPSGHGAPPSRSGPPPKSSPPPAVSPGSPAQGNGPSADHTPPGQAKKAEGVPGNGNGAGNGNGPADNHGQQMAAQHSHSPNH